MTDYLQKSTTMSVSPQLWECEQCQLSRYYGHGKPEHIQNRLLNCNQCKSPTSHRFIKVDRRA